MLRNPHSWPLHAQVEKPNPLPGKFGFHEIWHIFVILGALSHWCLMFFYVLPWHEVADPFPASPLLIRASYVSFSPLASTRTFPARRTR